MKGKWILLLSLFINAEAYGSGSTGISLQEAFDASAARANEIRNDQSLSFGHLVEQNQLIELKESDDGFDLYAQYGSRIHALGEGKVVYVGNFGDYKNLVIINHGRRVLSTYSHFDQVLVKEGQRVDSEIALGLASDLPLSISIREAGKVLSRDRLTELVKR